MKKQEETVSLTIGEDDILVPSGQSIRVPDNTCPKNMQASQSQHLSCNSEAELNTSFKSPAGVEKSIAKESIVSRNSNNMSGSTIVVDPRRSMVPNFRPSVGFTNVYRCSAPDNLVDVLDSDFLLKEERFILYDATLLVDLRSPSEVDLDRGRILLENAPGGKFTEINSVDEMIATTSKRQLLRLNDCALTRTKVMEYVAQNWISKEKLSKVGPSLADKKPLVFEALNAKGLSGLVEVILETKLFIANVLKAMTIHLENQNDGKIIFHCNIGKDRAGVLAMLCASILGVADDEIIADFAKSFCVRSLAEQRYIEIFQGHADPIRFAHASPETMVQTLQYLRQKYGSIDNYLNSTGFDESWRTRFINVAS